MTVGLHYYKGMVMGLAIQTIMAPLNLIENPLIKALFWSGNNKIAPEDRIFEEKYLNELSADDEVVDDQGNPVVRRPGDKEKNSTAALTAGPAKTLEEVMLDTWDAGSKADLQPLLSALTKKNCNTQTTEDHWTPLMILAGVGARGTASAIRQVIHEFGANPAICDKEGWNCLHWAAFHGSEEGAKELCKERSLMTVKDKEGFTPLETARKEGNDSVADVLEAAKGESKKSK
jgi:hypothetical protein